MSPSQKWIALFNDVYEKLGLTNAESSNLQNVSLEKSMNVWKNVAAIITKTYRDSILMKNSSYSLKEKDLEDIDYLNRIPDFSSDKLTSSTYAKIQGYLSKAFESKYHPLGALLLEIVNGYTIAYGGVRVHPLLLTHAISEYCNISIKLYEVVLLFFPKLPAVGEQYILKSNEEEASDVEVHNIVDSDGR